MESLLRFAGSEWKEKSENCYFQERQSGGVTGAESGQGRLLFVKVRQLTDLPPLTAPPHSYLINENRTALSLLPLRSQLTIISHNFHYLQVFLEIILKSKQKSSFNCCKCFQGV